MQTIDNKTLRRLVRKHLNKSYRECDDTIVHGLTGLVQPADWYRDFAKAVIAVAQDDGLILRKALRKADAAINSMKVEAETAALGDEYMMRDACERISNEGLAASTDINNAVAGKESWWLQPEDMAALERLAETMDDGEGHDIGAFSLGRLAQFGCVQNHRRGYYSITAFGSYVLNDWPSARELPFRTNDERSEEFLAAITAAKGE